VGLSGGGCFGSAGGGGTQEGGGTASGSATAGTFGTGGAPGGIYVAGAGGGGWYGGGGGFDAGGGGGGSGHGPFNTTFKTGVRQGNGLARVSYPGRALDLTLQGTGSGFVDGSPRGIDCGPSSSTHTHCSSLFADGAQVTLKAHPNASADFAGFSGGGCSGTATSCTITMDQARSIDATFDLKQRPLDIRAEGTGFGYVASSPPGIDCGRRLSAPHTICDADYPDGTIVTLIAHPKATNTDFRGFSGGGCAGAALRCRLTMDRARSVSARFVRRSVSISRCKRCSSRGETTLKVHSSTAPDPMKVLVNIRRGGQVVLSRRVSTNRQGTAALTYSWQCDEAGRHIAQATPISDPSFSSAASSLRFKTASCRKRWLGQAVGSRLVGHRLVLQLRDFWERRTRYRVCLHVPHKARFCRHRATNDHGVDRWRTSQKLHKGLYRVAWFVDGRKVDERRVRPRIPEPPYRPCHGGRCGIAIKVTRQMARDVYRHESSARGYGARCRSNGSSTFDCDAIINGKVPGGVDQGKHYRCALSVTVKVAHGHARGRFTGGVSGNTSWCSQL
jgi:hypothetical protein